MSYSVAMIAALPREVKQLVRGWQQSTPAGNIFVWTKGETVVACAGMGTARAALAAQAALAARDVERLISVGVAGACDPRLGVGDVVHAGLVVDARTGERFGAMASPEVLVTSPSIAGLVEKRRLFQTYGACAVDMEAAAVARVAEMHGLAFAAIKAISDVAHFEMKELGLFATSDGQFRENAFAAYCALRPNMWSRLIKLGHNSQRAVNALTHELTLQLKG